MSTTLSQVLVSPIILNEVIDTLSLGISADELKNELVVTSSAASQVLTLTVTDTSASLPKPNLTPVPKLTNVSTVSVFAKAESNPMVGKTYLKAAFYRLSLRRFMTRLPFPSGIKR